MKTLDIVIPSYNTGKKLSTNINSILKQKVAPQWCFNYFLVDDASTDFSIKNLPLTIRNAIKIITLKNNHGRAAARNIGASHGNSSYILFIDSDCTMENNDTISVLIERLGRNYDVIYGSVRSSGEGFWSNYFDFISFKRDKLSLNKNLLGFSSQYFAVSREHFNACGGFNEEYLKYGFEDRDLILRLHNRNTRIGFTGKSKVFHSEVDSLLTITEKLAEAGQYTSKIFKNAHPEIYRKMKYGKLDVRDNPVKFKLIGMLIFPYLSHWNKLGEKIIHSKFLPFKLKILVVKLISAFAYMKGTSLSS